MENLFNSGNMKESEYLVLSEWFNFLVSSPQMAMNFKVDQIIYLRTDPEIVYERIKNRNRLEENTIPLQYLIELHNLHEEWLVHQTKVTRNYQLKHVSSPCKRNIILQRTLRTS